VVTAEQLQARALAANGLGRYSEARRLYLRALSRTSDPPLIAALRRGLSYAETELGNAAGGLEMLDRTITEARSLPDVDRGMLLSQRGLLRLRLVR